MIKVAIIGSSQVVGDASTYQSAVKAVRERLNLLNIPMEKLELISGGSSWADHITVTLFNDLKEQGVALTLFLPADLAITAKCGNAAFKESYSGKELNKRHRAFSTTCFDDPDKSLNELNNLLKPVNEKTFPVTLIIDTKGFKSRNSKIANAATYLIAVSNTEEVSGGTKDTWDKFQLKNKANSYLIYFDDFKISKQEK